MEVCGFYQHDLCLHVKFIAAYIVIEPLQIVRKAPRKCSMELFLCADVCIGCGDSDGFVPSKQVIRAVMSSLFC